MGTSGSYSGSGGAWNGARGELADLLSGGNGTVADVLAPAAGAINWAPSEDDGGDAVDAAGMGAIPFRGTGVSPIRIRSRGGAGGGVGGGGARGGGGGGSRGGGSGRSRQRAARIGAGVAAAGYALRAGDAAALRRLGLDLAALAALPPSQQAQRIIAALAGPASTIEDGEVTAAASTMIIRLLEADAPPTAAEAVAVFATEYVYEIMLTELGSEMRDGTHDGSATIVTEDELHSVIEARVVSLAIEGESIAADALESAIDEVLEFTRRVLFERPEA
ncbi:MAG TPA: hypothetical protein VGO31_06300 [Microbacteriaceae bacterium]|nr:hypothetical protein [Microbacteriaceae bacterium]